MSPIPRNHNKGSTVKDREQQQTLTTIKFRSIFKFYHVDGHLGSQPLPEITDMGAMAVLLKNYATNLGQSSSLTRLGHLVIVIGCHPSP